MESAYKLQTPILFLIFNRPDFTLKVFDEIRKVKPNQLFIASDGARVNKNDEKDIVEKLRIQILNSIDWDCEVHTLFREQNLGCKLAVSGAISWFFEHVEQGIILEDDCLPGTSFFRFCEEMLEKYKNVDKIMSITGFNVLNNFLISESYVFSKYFYSWGWATWKRAWLKLDLRLEKYREEKKNKPLKKYYSSFIERKIRKKKAQNGINNKVNSWATPWTVSHHMNYGLSIVPRCNLIENIGFSNKHSTHTEENLWDKRFLYHKSNEIEFPLIHPNKIIENKTFFKRYLFHEMSRILLKKIHNSLTSQAS